MKQFRCEACKFTTFANIPPTKCESCTKENTFEFIETICMLVPKSQLPDHTVVHTSRFKFNSLQVFVSRAMEGMQWVTACNAPKKPKVVTNSWEACTCPKCMEMLKVVTIKESAKMEQQEPDQSIPNPFSLPKIVNDQLNHTPLEELMQNIDLPTLPTIEEPKDETIIQFEEDN